MLESVNVNHAAGFTDEGLGISGNSIHSKALPLLTLPLASRVERFDMSSSEDRSSADSAQSGFHADGEDCLRRGIAETLRSQIVEAVGAEYAQRLSVA